MMVCENPVCPSVSHLPTCCSGAVPGFPESALGISAIDGGQVSQYGPRGSQRWTATPVV